MLLILLLLEATQCMFVINPSTHEGSDVVCTMVLGLDRGGLIFFCGEACNGHDRSGYASGSLLLYGGLRFGSSFIWGLLTVQIWSLPLLILVFCK